MRKHCALLLALAVVSCVKAGLETTDDVCTKMDDINFMKYCYENFDVNEDGKVSMEEAAAVKKIDCRNTGITSIKGINYFSNVESLVLNGLKLTSFDPSPFQKLTSLFLCSNKLTHIDCSRNAALTGLDISFNPLEALDLSKNSNLKSLNCDNCGLASIQFPVTIIRLSCANNKLTSLDLGKCTDLYAIWSNGNSLTEIDLTTTKWIDQYMYPAKFGSTSTEFFVEDSRELFFQNNDVIVYGTAEQLKNVYVSPDRKFSHNVTFKIK